MLEYFNPEKNIFVNKMLKIFNQQKYFIAENISLPEIFHCLKYINHCEKYLIAENISGPPSCSAGTPGLPSLSITRPGRQSGGRGWREQAQSFTLIGPEQLRYCALIGQDQKVAMPALLCHEDTA